MINYIFCSLPLSFHLVKANILPGVSRRQILFWLGFMTGRSEKIWEDVSSVGGEREDQ